MGGAHTALEQLLWWRRTVLSDLRGSCFAERFVQSLHFALYARLLPRSNTDGWHQWWQALWQEKVILLNSHKTNDPTLWLNHAWEVPWLCTAYCALGVLASYLFRLCVRWRFLSPKFICVFFPTRWNPKSIANKGPKLRCPYKHSLGGVYVYVDMYVNICNIT